MSDIIMEEQNLYDIADAIREKLGSEDLYMPSEMAGAVRQISGAAVQSDWDQDDSTADDYIKNKPTNVSDFINDSGFVTSTVNNLVNYYKKTDTYTQAEVDALISAIVTLDIKAVSVLPTTNISMTTIYLVPSADPQAQNVKDEYINTDGTSAGWELIGSTAIDLTGYVTDAELTAALADYVTSTALSTALAGYVQKSQTAGLLKNDGTVDTNSYATASQLAGKQDTISDLSTIRSGASAGATAYQKPSGGIPKTDLASAVQTSLGKADSAIQSHQPAVKYDTASQGLTDTQKSNARTNIGAGTSNFSGAYNDLTGTPTIPDVSGKADKVSGATSGNVATLNASGNLVDSGKTLGKSVPSDAVFTDTKNTAGSTDTSSKIYLIGATSQAANPQTYSQDTAYVGTDGCLYSGGSKVLTSHQSITGKADKVSGATSGNFAGLDANGNLTDSGKKPGDLLTLGTSSSTAYRGDRGNTAYTHATETRLTTATAQGLYKVGSTAQGHISGLTAVVKSDITALGIPAQDTTYESKSASSGGTAVSLCTTGEKYTWNSKQNALSSMSQSEANTGTATTGRIITAKVLTDTIHTKSHTLYGATQLLSSANLNSITAPTYSGEYYYPIHGHSITNMPTGASGKPFRLIVESLSNKDADLATGTGDLDYSSSNCTLQTLIVSDIAGTPSVKTYRRHYLNSTWSAWYSYEDEIASLNSRLAYHVGDKYYFRVISYFTDLANGYVDADNKNLNFIYYLDKPIGSDVTSITISNDLWSAVVTSHGSAYITFSPSNVDVYRNGNNAVMIRITYTQNHVSGGTLPASGRATICGRPNECTYCFLNFA